MGFKANAAKNKKPKKTGWIIGGVAACLVIGAFGGEDVPIETAEDTSADTSWQETVTSLPETNETFSDDVVRGLIEETDATTESVESQVDLIVLPVETMPDVVETEWQWADTEHAVTETEAVWTETTPIVAETKTEWPETVPAFVETEAVTITYILNTNTKKIHYSSCSSVKDIKEKNKGSTTNYNDAIGAGYVPCKKCNP